ncbi:MAG: S1C family serine protease [Patescibacteria group bacterium]
MKTKPVPTSPKVRNRKDIVDDIYKQDSQKLFDKPKIKQHNIFILVIAILSGFFAGILGETIINALAVSYPNLPFISSLYVKTYESDNNVIVLKNGKTIEVQEFERLKTLDQIQTTVVTVFEKKNIGSENNNILEQIYQSGDALGSALILTNDGLLITTNQVIADVEREYVAMTSDKKIYLIDSIIDDSATDLVFFRIDAKNLSVVEFVDPMELHIGQQMLSLVNKTNGSYESDSTEIKDLLYYKDSEIGDAIYSTERVPDLISMTNSFPNNYRGAPVININGKVAGIGLANEAGDINLIIPGEYVQKIVPRILKDGVLKRVSFGVMYVDLSRTTRMDNSIVGENEVGALIYGSESPSVTAVANGSPAEKIGLQINDIIISIDGKEISKTDSLSEIIQSFQPGESVDILYIREGEKNTLSEVLLTESE